MADRIGNDVSFAGSLILLALFSVFIPSVLALGILYRAGAFAAAILTALVLEILGCVGLALVAHGQDGRVAFSLAYVGTTSGPTFIALALFQILPQMVHTYGAKSTQGWSIWYSRASIALAVICTLLDICGSALWAIQDRASGSSAEVGLLATGLGLLVVALVSFIYYSFHLALVIRRRRSVSGSSFPEAISTAKMKMFMAAYVAAALVLTARTIYRFVFVALQARDKFFVLVNDGILAIFSLFFLIALFPGLRLLSPCPHRQDRGSQTSTQLPAFEAAGQPSMNSRQRELWARRSENLLNKQQQHQQQQDTRSVNSDEVPAVLPAALTPKSQSPRSPDFLLSGNRSQRSSATHTTRQGVASPTTPPFITQNGRNHLVDHDALW